MVLKDKGEGGDEASKSCVVEYQTVGVHVGHYKG